MAWYLVKHRKDFTLPWVRGCSGTLSEWIPIHCVITSSNATCGRNRIIVLLLMFIMLDTHRFIGFQSPHLLCSNSLYVGVKLGASLLRENHRKGYLGHKVMRRLVAP